MHFLKYYKEKIIKQDLINKFKYNSVKNIPEIKKITLHFSFKYNNLTIQTFATAMLALEIMVTKKGSLTIATNANLYLKIQKGQPTGCKIILKKKKMYSFLNKLFLEILPKLKQFLGFKIQIQNHTFFFKLTSNLIKLKEFEEQYPLFSNLPSLDIYVSTNTKNRKELIFLIQALKFPILKNINTIG